jgi:hypothetical protein
MSLRRVISCVLLIAAVALAQQIPATPVAAADAPYQVRYAANLQFGESYITFTNDGANGAPVLGPGLGAAVGNICVNVYAFDPNEEMISCCSCLVTPNQVKTLGVNHDIMSNTATGLVPTSITLKLLATLAGGNGSSTNCSNAAASVAGATIVGGYTAYGTTLHATPVAGTFATTATRFTPATLSTGELNHLANTCSGIIGNLSGFGVCLSCPNTLPPLANPTIVTTPSPTSVTAGTTATLKDTAVLAGGANPTGTITFTLVAPGGTTVHTETVTVTGNGTYTTPTGFSLPANAAAGTYQWNSSYSGDTNNNPVSETNLVNEQVIVGKASPAIVTTPNPTTATVGSATVTLKDSAVLSGGASPTGSITFTLVAPGGATVDTETVTVTGNGTYTTPTGFALTTGAAAGTYQWNASYTGDSNNGPASENNAVAEQVIVASKGSPTITTTPSASSVTLGGSSVTMKDSATLSGGNSPTGSITFTLVGPGGTTVDTETVTVTGNGTYTTPTGFTLPTSGSVTGTYQWNATYNGDSNNNAVSENNNAAEQVTVSKATAAITTTPNPTTGTVGTAATLKDSLTLSGGYNPTGTITFTLVAPGGATVDTETVTVTGNGTYSTPTGFSLPTTGSVGGTYQWNASYSGDANNNAVTDINAPGEQVTIVKATGTISTRPDPPSVNLSTSPPTALRDVATLTGAFNPTGTITFTLVGPGGTVVDTETVTVSGNGTYITPTGFVVQTGSPTGTYQWNVTYSGDANNAPASDINDATEQVPVH